MKKVILSLIIFCMLATTAIAQPTEKPILVEEKYIPDVPVSLENKISITDPDLKQYKVSEQNGKIIIQKSGKHTSTTLKIEKSVIEALPGYDGEKFAVVHIADSGKTTHRVIYTDKALDRRTNSVSITTDMSTVIIGGAVGMHTKTVSSVNMLNTTIPLDIVGSTLVTINMSNPGPYKPWSQTNLSTYPGEAGKWLVVWPFNGNANDISGNGHHGTVFGTGAYTTGRNGAANNALSFDGDGDYVYYDYPNTLYSHAEMVWLWKTTSTTQGVIGDFRQSNGEGRTAMYNTEQAVYLDNGTVQNAKWTDKADGNWHWAFYPFNPAQINAIYIGKRYAPRVYYLTADIDLAALYNGTLSADDRRTFTYGYSGVTASVLPNSSRYPVTTESTTIETSGNISGVNIQSNKAGTKNITLTAAFVHDYTLISESDNGTHVVVDILYTPESNTTSGTMNYTLTVPFGGGTPHIQSNDTSASVSLENSTLYIGFGEIPKLTTKYYTVTIPNTLYNISSYYPLTPTPSVLKNKNITFSVTASGNTQIHWYVNDSHVKTDLGNMSDYTFSTGVDGQYEISVVVGLDSQSWLLTVFPDQLTAFEPLDSNISVKNNSIQRFYTMYAYRNDVVWLLNGTTVWNDYNTTISAYWMNASGNGDYNVTARIDNTQHSWTVHVVTSTDEDSGSFVAEGVAVVIIGTVGILYSLSRRRR